jgi:hypothetical protein
MAVETRSRGDRGLSAGSGAEGAFEVVVLYTTVPGTLESLRRAADLAEGLAARIRLLVLTVVPYPLTMESPAVPLPFARRRFITLANEARVDTLVDIRLGRDEERMLEAALKPGSLVVLERRKWWPARERRLARRLQRLGHNVVYSN